MRVWGARFRVEEFRVQVVGFRVWESRVQGVDSRV